MHAIPRALEIGETRGFMKAIVDAETQHILGIEALQPHFRNLII